MAQATTQLFSRQSALLVTGVPVSIDTVLVLADGTASYTVPAGTYIIQLSTNTRCLFRDGSETASAVGSGVTDGTGSTWLEPGVPEAYRTKPAATISFRGNDETNSEVTIRRYTGTNSALPPD